MSGTQGWRAQPADVLTTVVDSLRLRGSVFCRAEMAAPWGLSIPEGPHAHFHLVERGSCWLRLQGVEEPVPVSSGDLVVVPHGRGHVLLDNPRTPAIPLAQLVGPRAASGPHRMRHGGNGPETRLVCGAFRFERRDGHPLLSLLPPVVHIPGDRGRPADGIESLLRFLAAETRDPRPGTEAIVSRLSEVLFVEALRAWMEDLPEGEGGWLGALRDRHVGAALGLIHRYPDRDWTVAALAAEVGMSRSPFAARFAALVGEPPLSYLTRWRMHTAAELLQDDALSLAQVASRVGYESEPAFSKAFKRQFGIPPGTWRRRPSAA
jgi:AraC-like DNA-binding protein